MSLLNTGEKLDTFHFSASFVGSERCFLFHNCVFVQGCLGTSRSNGHVGLVCQSKTRYDLYLMAKMGS